LYAQTSFVDTKHGNRRVQWGWAPEDILDLTLARKQGFQGAFGLPRELFAHVTEGVCLSKGNERSMPPSGSHFTPADEVTYTASTLGMKPLKDVVIGLRQGATHHMHHFGIKSGPEHLNKGSRHMELAANLCGSPRCRTGVYVAASSTPPNAGTGWQQPERG
jgi:beta-fructofuranosidase